MENELQKIVDDLTLKLKIAQDTNLSISQAMQDKLLMSILEAKSMLEGFKNK